MLVTISDLKSKFRVENGMPDAIIQKHIDKVENDFVHRFGHIFTDVVADPTTYADDAVFFRGAILNLVMCNLLGESLVVTGFGTVVKRDEYSDNINYDETQKYAKQCAKDAVYSLEKISGINERLAAQTITDLQGFTEGFFDNRSERNLSRYYPYHLF